MTQTTEFLVAGIALPITEGRGSTTARLTDALRNGIQLGRLPAGLVVPPSRSLATELGVSRWVVTEAYGQLVAEGYLAATIGSGTRVREVATGPTPPIDLAGLMPSRPRFDLAPGLADLSEFPRTRWAEAYRRAVLQLPNDRLAGWTVAETMPARTVIAEYLQRTRQIRETPSQLGLTRGATATVGWLARLLVSLGHQRVAVEDPSWPGLRQAARRGGLQPVPVGVDSDGLRVDDLIGLDRVRVVIVTPAHQFPTGVAMSPERRLALIDWAERVDGLVIEDDYDAEFRYDRRPVASLQGMAPERVIMVGSVSKSLGPALGCGWLVLPQQLLARMLTDDLELNASPDPFVIEAFATMIRNGWYERHLRAARLRYRRRRDALVAAIGELLPGCEPSGLPAGLHLSLGLPQGTDVEALVERARALEVGVVDAARYAISPSPQPGLVIGYGNLRTGREREAISRLARALAGP